ncbi:MAG TPA: amino acid-binding protein [Verrucomicrobiae bacterium]
MSLKIQRTSVWATSIEDRPAGLAEKLTALNGSGAHLEFILARRAPEMPGHGVVFIAPVKGAKQSRAADKAGFVPTEALHALRVEGIDKAGLGQKLTQALATTGINLRGFSAATIGRKFVAYLAFDEEEESKQAMRSLKKLK